MASFATALDWALSFEDSQHSYACVMDNNGAGVISGINAKSFPVQFAAIQAIPQAERGCAVEQFYRENFWSDWFERIGSDDIAKRVFDMAVNAGQGTAVRLLQKAIGLPIVPDGILGLQTVAAVNAADSAVLVTSFQLERVDYYKAVAAANVADARFLSVWTARALA